MLFAMKEKFYELIFRRRERLSLFLDRLRYKNLFLKIIYRLVTLLLNISISFQTIRKANNKNVEKCYSTV